MHQTQQFEEPDAVAVRAEQHNAVLDNEQQTTKTAVNVPAVSAEHLVLGNVVKRDHNRRIVVISTLPFLPFAALGAIKACLPEHAWIDLCANPLFVVSALATCIAVPLWTLKPSKRARKATGKLAQIDDLSAIGSMVETINYTDDPGTAAQVQETLIRLLPQIRASDAYLISNRQMVMLQHMLKMPSFTHGDLFVNPFKKRAEHARLQLAILKAFEQIGDGTVESGVLHARDHGANREVKRAAAECLPYIQQRVELAKANKTLLRASSASAADTSMLVRAVETSLKSNIGSEELLRPQAELPSDTIEVPVFSTAPKRSED